MMKTVLLAAAAADRHDVVRAGADADGDELAWRPRITIRRAPAPARMPMYMFGDTLVSLDYDLKTIKPLLAKSWTISEDGKTYTFNLRDDVTFCSGKKFTAKDVVYTVNRVMDKETKSPFTWRMGKVKEVRAKDDVTVEYELEEPFSELLQNLTVFQATIVNEENVKALGRDFGVKGIDGTGTVLLHQLGAAQPDGADAAPRIQVGS